MDLTPLIPEGRQIVQGYGDGKFRIAEVVHEGSVLVFADRTLAWPVARFEEVGRAALDPLIAAATELDILVLGCGTTGRLLAPALRQALREHGIVVETMDTGAACRTYNVLAAEGRRVAAALIAV